MKTKLHISLVALKALMLKTLAAIAKKWEPHLSMTYYMCIIHQRMENTSRVGCYCKAMTIKVSQNKQCSSHWVPLLCT
jgi:hypothetical protein